MSSYKSLIRSVLVIITTALLLNTSACVFSRGPIKDLVLAPADAPAENGGDIVGGGTDNAARGDDVINPENPSAETPQGGETQPTAENPEPTPDPNPSHVPTPSSDVCHRIAIVQAVDGLQDEVVVGDDCVDSPKIHVPQQSITLNTNFANQEPTFSSDGSTLSTYFVSWIGRDAASIKSIQSLWLLENGSALPKDALLGDLDSDGDNDLVRFFAAGNPFSAEGRLTVTAEQPVCGNGVVDGFEACDDGNQDDTDECSNACEKTSGFSVGRVIPQFNKTLIRSVDHVLPKTIAQATNLEGAVVLSDGTVVFSAQLEGDQDSNLYAFDVNDANAAPVKIGNASDDGVSEGQVALAPEGNKIAYLSGAEILTCELTVVATLPNLQKHYSCTAAKTLSNGIFVNVKNSEPCFSHDGRFVFFLSPAPHGLNGQEHDREVWRVNAEDGSNPINVTDDGLDQRALSCSPAAGPNGTLK